MILMHSYVSYASDLPQAIGKLFKTCIQDAGTRCTEAPSTLYLILLVPGLDPERLGCVRL